MNDIGGFGLNITLTASKTYPQGVSLSQFADDADPFDSESIAIVDKAMGLNGDLIVWSKAVPLPLSISVIPNSDDDIALTQIANANRVGKNKTSARDVIGIVGVYPDGTSVTLKNGKLTECPQW